MSREKDPNQPKPEEREPSIEKRKAEKPDREQQQAAELFESIEKACEQAGLGEEKKREVFQKIMQEYQALMQNPNAQQRIEQLYQRVSVVMSEQGFHIPGAEDKRGAAEKVLGCALGAGKWVGSKLAKLGQMAPKMIKNVAITASGFRLAKGALDANAYRRQKRKADQQIPQMDAQIEKQQVELSALEKQLEETKGDDRKILESSIQLLQAEIQKTQSEKMKLKSEVVKKMKGSEWSQAYAKRQARQEIAKTFNDLVYLKEAREEQFKLKDKSFDERIKMMKEDEEYKKLDKEVQAAQEKYRQAFKEIEETGVLTPEEVKNLRLELRMKMRTLALENKKLDAQEDKEVNKIIRNKVSGLNGIKFGIRETFSSVMMWAHLKGGYAASIARAIGYEGIDKAFVAIEKNKQFKAEVATQKVVEGRVVYSGLRARIRQVERQLGGREMTFEEKRSLERQINKLENEDIYQYEKEGFSYEAINNKLQEALYQETFKDKMRGKTEVMNEVLDEKEIDYLKQKEALEAKKAKLKRGTRYAENIQVDVSNLDLKTEKGRKEREKRIDKEKKRLELELAELERQAEASDKYKDGHKAKAVLNETFRTMWEGTANLWGGGDAKRMKEGKGQAVFKAWTQLFSKGMMVAMPALRTEMMETGSDVINWVADKIPKLGDWVEKQLDSLGDAAGNLDQLGGGVGEGFKRLLGLSETMPELGKKIDDLLDTVPGLVKNYTDKMLESLHGGGSGSDMSIGQRILRYNFITGRVGAILGGVFFSTQNVSEGFLNKLFGKGEIELPPEEAIKKFGAGAGGEIARTQDVVAGTGKGAGVPTTKDTWTGPLPITKTVHYDDTPRIPEPRDEHLDITTPKEKSARIKLDRTEEFEVPGGEVPEKVPETSGVYETEGTEVIAERPPTAQELGEKRLKDLAPREVKTGVGDGYEPEFVDVEMSVAEEATLGKVEDNLTAGGLGIINETNSEAAKQAIGNNVDNLVEMIKGHPQIVREHPNLANIYNEYTSNGKEAAIDMVYVDLIKPKPAAGEYLIEPEEFDETLVPEEKLTSEQEIAKGQQPREPGLTELSEGEGIEPEATEFDPGVYDKTEESQGDVLVPVRQEYTDKGELITVYEELDINPDISPEKQVAAWDAEVLKKAVKEGSFDMEKYQSYADKINKLLEKCDGNPDRLRPGEADRYNRLVAKYNPLEEQRCEIINENRKAKLDAIQQVWEGRQEAHAEALSEYAEEHEKWAKTKVQKFEALTDTELEKIYSTSEFGKNYIEHYGGRQAFEKAQENLDNLKRSHTDMENMTDERLIVFTAKQIEIAGGTKHIAYYKGNPFEIVGLLEGDKVKILPMGTDFERPKNAEEIIVSLEETRTSREMAEDIIKHNRESIRERAKIVFEDTEMDELEGMDKVEGGVANIMAALEMFGRHRFSKTAFEGMQSAQFDKMCELMFGMDADGNVLSGQEAAPYCEYMQRMYPDTDIRADAFRAFKENILGSVKYFVELKTDESGLHQVKGYYTETGKVLDEKVVLGIDEQNRNAALNFFVGNYENIPAPIPPDEVVIPDLEVDEEEARILDKVGRGEAKAKTVVLTETGVVNEFREGELYIGGMKAKHYLEKSVEASGISTQQEFEDLIKSIAPRTPAGDLNLPEGGIGKVKVVDTSGEEYEFALEDGKVDADALRDKNVVGIVLYDQYGNAIDYNVDRYIDETTGDQITHIEYASKSHGLAEHPADVDIYHIEHTDGTHDYMVELKHAGDVDTINIAITGVGEDFDTSGIGEKLQGCLGADGRFHANAETLTRLWEVGNSCVAGGTGGEGIKIAYGDTEVEFGQSIKTESGAYMSDTLKVKYGGFEFEGGETIMQYNKNGDVEALFGGVVGFTSAGGNMRADVMAAMTEGGMPKNIEDLVTKFQDVCGGDQKIFFNLGVGKLTGTTFETNLMAMMVNGAQSDLLSGGANKRVEFDAHSLMEQVAALENASSRSERNAARDELLDTMCVAVMGEDAEHVIKNKFINKLAYDEYRSLRRVFKRGIKFDDKGNTIIVDVFNQQKIRGGNVETLKTMFGVGFVREREHGRHGFHFGSGEQRTDATIAKDLMNARNILRTEGRVHELSAFTEQDITILEDNLKATFGLRGKFSYLESMKQSVIIKDENGNTAISFPLLDAEGKPLLEKQVLACVGADFDVHGRIGNVHLDAGISAIPVPKDIPKDIKDIMDLGKGYDALFTVRGGAQAEFLGGALEARGEFDLSSGKVEAQLSYSRGKASLHLDVLNFDVKDLKDLNLKLLSGGASMQIAEKLKVGFSAGMGDLTVYVNGIPIGSGTVTALGGIALDKSVGEITDAISDKIEINKFDNVVSGVLSQKYLDKCSVDVGSPAWEESIKIDKILDKLEGDKGNEIKNLSKLYDMIENREMDGGQESVKWEEIYKRMGGDEVADGNYRKAVYDRISDKVENTAMPTDSEEGIVVPTELRDGPREIFVKKGDVTIKIDYTRQGGKYELHVEGIEQSQMTAKVKDIFDPGKQNKPWARRMAEKIYVYDQLEEDGNNDKVKNTIYRDIQQIARKHARDVNTLKLDEMLGVKRVEPIQIDKMLDLLVDKQKNTLSIEELRVLKEQIEGVASGTPGKAVALSTLNNWIDLAADSQGSIDISGQDRAIDALASTLGRGTGGGAPDVAEPQYADNYQEQKGQIKRKAA